MSEEWFEIRGLGGGRRVSLSFINGNQEEGRASTGRPTGRHPVALHLLGKATTEGTVASHVPCSLARKQKLSKVAPYFGNLVICLAAISWGLSRARDQHWASGGLYRLRGGGGLKNLSLGPLVGAERRLNSRVWRSSRCPGTLVQRVRVVL